MTHVKCLSLDVSPVLDVAPALNVPPILNVLVVLNVAQALVRAASRLFSTPWAHASPGVATRYARVRAPRAHQALVALVLATASLYASVDGTVINGTSGQPQPNVVVTLVQPGQAGMQTLGSTKSDAQGRFRIDKAAEGPQLVQALYEGVSYNKMITPGAPSTGIQVDVFDATKDARIAKTSQHIVFLQPSAEQLAVNEVYFVKNDTKKTLNNPSDGTLQFYVPGHTAQADSVRVTISAPGGMPVKRPAEAASSPGVYKVVYPVKPGETEFNVAYSLPAGTVFASKSVQKGIDTRLVVPSGVTLQGDGVTSLGQDPSGKASLYSVTGQEYSVNIGGSAESAPAGGGEGAQDEETGQPQIRQTDPRLYSQLPIVLGLAGAILLLGLILLYRSDHGAKGKTRR